MAQVTFSNGKTATFQGTPTPDDIDFVAKQMGIQPDAAKAPAAPSADETSAKETGATFAADTSENRSPALEGAKAVGNVPASAFNFAKNTASMLNPVPLASSIGQIPEDVKMSGGVLPYLNNLGGSIPEGLYNTLIPDLLKQGFKGAVGGLANAFGKGVNLPGGITIAPNTPDTGNQMLDEAREGAQRDVVNDPVGSIAPFILGAKGIVEGKDAMRAPIGDGEPPAAPGPASKALDTTMSRVASPVTKPAAAVGNFIADKAAPAMGAVGRYAFGQATGLEPSTIETRIANPKVDMSSLSRASTGAVIKNALGERISNLGETGGEYTGIRNSTKPVTVDSAFLGSAIEDATGLKLQNMEKEGTGFGKFVADASSKIDDPANIAKVQRLYESWQPKFDAGTITPEDFLTLRSKLAKIAYNDLGIKNGDMASAAENVRNSLNAEYRDQIEGLSEKDAAYSSQKIELKNLRKGILDKNDELTDGALNKIANATGKGKDALIARLEEISPGITKQIHLVKMAEDFEAAAGSKVATYTRSGATIGGAALGFATAGPIGAVAGALAEMVLQTPAVADAIIKTYGKSKPLMQAVAKLIRSSAGKVNNAPTSITAPTSVFGSRPALPATQ